MILVANKADLESERVVRALWRTCVHEEVLLHDACRLQSWKGKSWRSS